ncbi:MAG: helix-turn-helix domain-containing protein [Candidatus Eisenbacteria bacterium]|nr:helix-turn-helix domain-containing protein [Candidatus Eisenbacteria bacterium]
MDSDARDILTIGELAKYLKIPKSTLYKLAQEGRLPGQKVGRHWRFRRQAIDRWLERPPVVVSRDHAAGDSQPNGDQ